MRKHFTGVRVLVWDFDGTLYTSKPELTRDIIEADYRLVMRHTGWDREKAVAEFHKVYKVKTPSSTETAAYLSGISVVDAAIEYEEYTDRRPYLSRDERLIAMFRKLTGYTHYMLANGVQQKIIQCLEVIGLPADTFAEIVTAETVGVNKPQPQGFTHILDATKFPPEAHLMIGDREPVDLLPAKAMGMKTCLVWHDTPGVVADVTLPSVYELEGMIG